MCQFGDMGIGSTGWKPPHCPNPNCTYFNTLSPNWPFTRKGFYDRQRRPHRIQRFTCRACKRHFSSQTFSTSYWQKRSDLAPNIILMVVGCMGNRQMARALVCSPTTVAHHIARLGRHCLLLQARELARIEWLHEIAIDGFETFEWSQYFPFHHNVAVDVASGYFLYHTDSSLRRKGRMTAHQKTRRSVLEARLGKPPSNALEVGVRDLLAALLCDRTSVTVRSDDHPAYPRAFTGLRVSISHRITSSKERRVERNPLWEINVLDLMIRHSTAAHKRETIAWVKRRQASIEKLAIFQVWRNYVKRRREKEALVTPAMVLNLESRPWRVQDLLARRVFYEKTSLSPRWQDYYRRRVETRALSVNRTHELKYAF
jgi:transposase-like protein